MTDNVVDFTGVTTLDLDPQRVLAGALEEGLASGVVCGYTAEGEEYFASSAADGGEVLWLLERSKLKLLQQPDE